MNVMDVLRRKKDPEATGAPKKKPAMPRRRKIIIAAAAAAVVVWGAVSLFGGRNDAAAEQEPEYTVAQAQNRSITQSLTGSAMLEAANSYNVTALVEGEILSADFEEGDIVEEDTVLYEIDSSDASSNIETNQISLDSSQRAYENALESRAGLTVTSPIAGTVVSLDVDIGDEVSMGQTIATVRDSASMELELSFPADDAAGFYVGQSATVTLDSSFETLDAVVSHISGADTVTAGNMIVRTVTLTVENPGGIAAGRLATAEVGGVGSSGSGSFEYADERTVTAEVSGTVASIAAQEGDVVSAGGTLVQLTSDDIDDTIQSQYESLRRAEISLENAEKTLENYTITSPISGTIIDKNYNAGENTETGETLCTIYDLSYLTITLNVDELYISEVEVGQEVTITADAVEGTVFEGVVTKVSVAGTTSGGVTTYPVTIRIDETEGLMPGMNVDATIITASAENVLTIPIQALQRGDMVLITADSPSAGNALDIEAPEGYVYVAVTTGISDDDYIEVTSGLTEGDSVAYSGTAETETDMYSQMGGMMPPGNQGGPGGGGAPVGGPGGGM